MPASALSDNPAGTAEPTRPPLNEVDTAIRRAIDYLLAHQRSDGSFVYRVLIDEPDRGLGGYNIVRHAGVMYALSQALAAGFVGEDGRRALGRAAGYLADRLIEIPGLPGRLAVATVASIDGGRTEEAKLGAAGLGLAALVATERWCPGTVPAPALRGVGDFIIHLQDGEGRFHSKYRIVDPIGPLTGWQSLFYPGEAALGLLELADLEQATDRATSSPGPYRRAAVDALLHLARSRAGTASVPSDHWAMIATGRVLDGEVELSEADRQLLHGHGRQVCEAMLDRDRSTLGHPDRPRPLVHRWLCSTATVLEGLLAARAALDLGPLDAAVADWIESGVGFVAGSQLIDGPVAGGFLNDDRGRVRSAADGVDRGEREIRIDYVQHALSALLGYRAMGHRPRAAPAATTRQPAARFADGRPPGIGPGGGHRAAATEIDVRPYAGLASRFLATATAAGAVGSSSREVVQGRHPGLFQLARDLAEARAQCLYRARVVVVAPGCSIEDQSIVDRHLWTCHRQRMILSPGARLRIEVGDRVEELAPGLARSIDPVTSMIVDNPTAEPVVTLDVYSRPVPSALRAGAFERLATGIDVAPMAAELRRVIGSWDRTTRDRWLIPQRETTNLNLRSDWRMPGQEQAYTGTVQRSRYDDKLCRHFPLIYRWLEAFHQRANLDPGRARMVILRPGGHALPHYDGGAYYRLRDRHLLVVTGGSSSFTAGGETVRPQPGELWRFDNQLLHHATNHGTEPRAHLYFDARPWPLVDGSDRSV